MTASGSSRRAPPPLARAAAVLAVAAVGLAASLTVTASLRLDGGNGDWRAASEGLSRSGRGRAFLHWKAADAGWVAHLTPEMSALFRETAAWRGHALGWVSAAGACP